VAGFGSGAATYWKDHLERNKKKDYATSNRQRRNEKGNIPERIDDQE
jgi:hypothetical protein